MTKMTELNPNPYSGEKRFYGGPTELLEVIPSGDSEKDEGRPVILFGIRGAGGGAALSPVMEKLAVAGERVACFTDGDGERIIAANLGEKLTIVSKNDNDHKGLSFTRARSGNPLIRLGELVGETRVLVLDSSMAEWDPGLSMSLFAEAEYDNLPIVLVEYMPGTAVPFLREIKDLNALKAVCVANEDAKKGLMSSTGLKDEQVVVTGNPEFDIFAVESDEEREGKRRKAREDLGIASDEFLIDFATQPLFEIDEILELTIDKLNELMKDNKLGGKELVLLVSPHPRIRNDEKWWSKLNEAVKKFEGRIVQQGGRRSDEVRPAADLLVTVNSTEGLKAVCERTPTVYVLMEDDEFRKIVDEMFGLTILPLELNAAIRVSNSSELSASLQKVIADQKTRDNLILLAGRYFNFDGRAAERVVEVIKRIAVIPQQ